MTILNAKNFKYASPELYEAARAVDAFFIVALSGGADSTALLRLSAETLGRDKLAACHINHMIRGEAADADEAFCRELCETLGVPITVYRRNVPVLARERGTGIEETARDIRYECFLESAREHRGKTVYILTAHNADDNTETVIFNLIRGTGTEGLLGIPKMRTFENKVILMRPLLRYDKSDIIAYLAEINQKFVVDATNADTKYTRNLVREKIVPIMKQINPALNTAIARTSDIVRGTEEIAASLDEDGDDIIFLITMDRSLLSRAVRRAYEAAAMRLHGEYMTLPYASTEDIVEMIYNEKPYDRISLPGAVCVIKRDGKLFFEIDKRIKNR